MTDTGRAPRVLLLYYSFSGQASGLMHRLAGGLTSVGVEVVMERLHPEVPLRFPIGSIPRTFRLMFTSFIRCRVEIAPLPAICFAPYDLIILAGPTWSYSPSGPVLRLLDRDGRQLFAGRPVLPFISCRRYWRHHFSYLKRRLTACGAMVVNRLVFTHPSPEPALTLGVFLKLAGRNPEKSRFLGKWYHKYGHSQQQFQEAERVGVLLGEALRTGQNLADLPLPPA
ncbi:MAG: hypothetical protein COX17_08835 [Deltaproteobacteria bacterium CG23_combo_of_CG06-09_8_20_14_all_60_8]|nr:MAG: hypothetical protein COX17_08835 [Deltaproteobacteria bacterium CG23_combo_of_CG06-09_8_20_14_all_60_8]